MASDRAHTVYAVADASGSRVHLAPYSADIAWHRSDEYDTLESAREAIVDAIASLQDREDRGEDFERGWEDLSARADELDVDEILEFDEHAWRIVKAAAAI